MSTVTLTSVPALDARKVGKGAFFCLATIVGPHFTIFSTSGNDRHVFVCVRGRKTLQMHGFP